MIEHLFVLDLQVMSRRDNGVIINQGSVNTARFIFMIKNGAEDIPASSFTEAKITLSHNSLAILHSPCEIIGDEIVYNVEPEAVARPGIITGQLDLMLENGVLATTHFYFNVFRSLTDLTEAERKLYISGIQELLNKIKAGAVAADNVKDLIDEAYELLARLREDTLFTAGDVSVETLESGESADVDIKIIGNTMDFLFKIPQGSQGEKGADGTGINILGSFNTAEELRAAHPVGNIGDSYMVMGYLYVWSATLLDWQNVGRIQGPPGEPGVSGIPVGGLVGQVLTKMSEKDFDVAWTGSITPPTLPIFSNNSWAQISAASDFIEAGSFNAEQVREVFGWNIGDTKSIVMADVNYTVRIIGFNHDNKVGGGKAGITLELAPAVYGTASADMRRMNPTNSVIGGWDTSEMRNVVMPEMLSLLPIEIQQVIKTVIKPTSNNTASLGTLVNSEDKLWLLSQIEVLGNNSNSIAGEGILYSYYQANATTAARIKRLAAANVQWWLRSPYSSAGFFLTVTSSGGLNYVYASTAAYCGTSFGLCV